MFGTLYRRLRFSVDSKNNYNQQCLSMLLAGQHQHEVDLPEHKLISARDRGGLWKVSRNMFDIFKIAESIFQIQTKTCNNKIDHTVMVKSICENVIVQSNFDKLRSQATVDVKKEVMYNLLEDVIGLYIRTRTFSYVKDIQQKHELSANNTKAKSLRTGLKKMFGQ